MTYSKGGNIDAVGYNSFATTLTKIFADPNPGATAWPEAGYGYGVDGVHEVVQEGIVTAQQWFILYGHLRRAGLHQGTVVSPPVPLSGPNRLDDITAYNTPAMADTVALVETNRFNIAPTQIAFTSHSFTQAAFPVWVNSMSFTFYVNFGSWDNARHFFNSGGFLAINASMVAPHPTTAAERQWANMMSRMSPIVFNYNSTTPNSGLGGSSIGFYNLTTTMQPIYTSSTAGNQYYYNSDSITVSARLANTAGTDGFVNFKITLTDGDAHPIAKTFKTTYNISEHHSYGAVGYNGEASISGTGFTRT